MKQTWTLTQDQRESMPALYRSGLNLTDLAKRFRVDPSAVWGLLKRRGVTLRSLSESHTRYNCNHFFWNTLRFQQQAYWLGFWFADGYVSWRKRSSPVLVLALAPVDLVHLRKFKTAIRASHPIRFYWHREHRSARIVITSKPLAMALRRRVFSSPRKSIPMIPAHLQHHFIRGYFDGDGSITPLGVRNPAFRITAPRAICEKLQRMLMKSCRLRKTKFAYRFGTPSIVYVGRRQLRRIRAYLYHNASVWLSRKRQRFDGL